MTGVIVTRHNGTWLRSLLLFLPGGVAVNPPKNPEPFRQSLDSLGRLLFVRNFRCRFRFHVGRPFWLRLCLASFLARWPPYFLPSGVLSLLGFVRKWFLLSGLESVNLFWVCFWLWVFLYNRTKCCPFLFFAFCLGSLCLRLCPKKGTKNRTERTLGCSGRNSASPFLWFFASPNGQIRTARVRSCVTIGFYGFSFSEVSVLHNKFWQTNWAFC